MDRIEVKLASDDIDAKTGEFAGYGAVFGNLDSYGDVIEKGAFRESLREWETRGKLPPMLLQHGGGMFGGGADDMLPVGVWTSMEENAKGLKVRGKLFALQTERGQYIYEGLKSGALDGLSIGFMIRKSRLGTKPGEPARTLENIDLREVSIVTFPANPKARVSAVKSIEDMTIREMEQALESGTLPRLSARDAKALLSGGFKALRPARDAGETTDIVALLRRNLATLAS